MQYVLAPPPRPGLPVLGTDRLFPIRRVYCVGRNYAEHAREMGHDPSREAPFFFQKNPDNLVTTGRFPYPPGSSDVHFEVELVVALAAGGRDIAEADALATVFGYAVGLDMTRRDVQAEAKRMGRPWEAGKAFEASAPCSPIAAAASIGHPARGLIALDVNGTPRQRGDLADMIWPVAGIIAQASRLFELAAGDLIFTGTPAGVGPISVGDRLACMIAGVGRLDVEVTPDGRG
ncbi:MAG: fumarylacetoacetate hydrolase family protein [Hyphomicrobiaceae bacterium]|nr:fumarylacetoacetate hydrolase family protein [Hyphomicrobiaceae bacterium]